jgi:hypothetical protein
MNKSASDTALVGGSQTISLFAPTRQFSTTYREQTARLAATLEAGRPAPDVGRMGGMPTMPPQLNVKRRGAGIDPVEKAADEYPPLAASNEHIAPQMRQQRWTKYVSTVPTNYTYGNFNHVEPRMKTEEGVYIPLTASNGTGRESDFNYNDCRPSCFEFRAGYRHADYPLTKMSTSITKLPTNKKFWTNVHPKEIELGRQWQWTFRDCYVGRESCRNVRELKGYPVEGEF